MMASSRFQLKMRPPASTVSSLTPSISLITFISILQNVVGVYVAFLTIVSAAVSVGRRRNSSTISPSSLSSSKSGYRLLSPPSSARGREMWTRFPF